MPYIPFTEEQKLRANSVDLVEFLHRQGERLIPSGRDKRLSSDHSITVRGNEWYDHESKEGGHAISFVQTYYGLTYALSIPQLQDVFADTFILAVMSQHPELEVPIPGLPDQVFRASYQYMQAFFDEIT